MTDLLNKEKRKLDRSVISYAFLAQTTRGEGDLFRGLTPIFKPIAKIHAGEKFDVEEFAIIVDELYGLKVHPWAVEDLMPRLENAGLIHKNKIAENIHEFVYSEISEEFNDVTETDIKDVIQHFVEFSTEILELQNFPIDKSTLEEGFLSQLVEMSFVGILLKPDQSKKDARAGGTIFLKKTKNQEDWDEDASMQSKIDVLCASFIIDVYRTDTHLYDLVMRIATGAILSEVVLNLQHPGETLTLKGLNVALDAPLLMSVLNLTSKEDYTFAIEICRQLKEKGANLIAFDHSIDEMQSNLKAVINKTKDGIGFGATARRLNNSIFYTYANTVLQSTDVVLKRENIRIITAPKNNTLFQYFTESDQDDFEHSLGAYFNKIAQERDAESIAAIMRLRRGKRAKMEKLPSANCLFITENVRVVDQAIKFLKQKKLYRDGEVPPAMSEKYLAGLLWALYGGKGNELTRHLLLANCTAALEPRNDVIKKMHKFLSEIDEKQAELFSALMTEERAGQYTMQLTFGDSAFITKENVPVVLEKIKSSLIEKHTAEKKTELDKMQRAHEEQLSKGNVESERLRKQLFDASSETLQTQSELTETKRRVEQIEASLEGEKNARIHEKRKLVEKCLKKALRYERNIHLVLGCVVAAVIGLVTWFKLLNSQIFLVKVVAMILISIIPILSFWKIPDYFLANWVHKIRANKFKEALEDFDIYEDLKLFSIDWESQRVVLKEDTENSIGKETNT